MKKRWKEGEVYAEAQNLARTLMELPANMLTPTLFAERIQKEFSGVGNVEVVVRDAGEFFNCCVCVVRGGALIWMWCRVGEGKGHEQFLVSGKG